MKQLVKLGLLLMLMVTAAPVLAETGKAGGALPELRYGVGARAFALGSAYVAVANDPTAVYWNPAGLARLEAPAVTGMHSDLYVGTKFDFLGWATSGETSGWGVSYLHIYLSGIDNTEGLKDSASTSVLYWGYGREVGGWQFGLTGKYINTDLLGATGTGWSMDFGIQRDLNRNFRVALVAQDLVSTGVKWESGLEEKIPTNYRAGLAYQREKLLLSMETERAADFSEEHFGFEYQLARYLKIRSGLRGSDFTAGIGLAKDHWSFDYAYCAHDLGNTHRLSFSVDFLGK